MTEQNLRRHIDDERISAWSQKSEQELMEMLDRLMDHIGRLSGDQRQRMMEVASDLESYLQARIENSDLDLDVILIDA